MTKLKTIFILSTGRSGTKSIADSFNQLDNIKAFHEPMPWLLRENILHYWDKMLGKEYYLKGPVKRILDKRKKLIEQVHKEGKHYVESSHFLSTFSNELVEAFPDAIIIHLIRDGRDVVRSGMDFNWYKGLSMPQVKCTTQSNPYGVIAWQAPIECDDRFSKCCYYWYLTNKIISDDLDELTKNKNYNLYEIKLENPESISILPIVLGISDKKMNLLHTHTGIKKFPYWKQWNKKNTKDAERIMGEMLKKYEYIK